MMNLLPLQSCLRLPLISLLCVTLLTVLSGCSFLKPANDQAHNYLLTAVPSPEPSAKVSPPCIVRVLPVEVPNYLQTSDMVIRTGTNEVVFTKFNRWAEPLDAGIRRVLAQNLRGFRGIQEALVDEPSPARPKLYIISVHILECEGSDINGRGSTLFSAAWDISQGRTEATLARGVFRAPPASWRPGDYAGMVTQLSSAVADLSGILAQAISRQTGAHGAPH